MKFRLLLSAMIMALVLTACQDTPEDGNVRMKYNFNSDWLIGVGDFDGAESVSFDDSMWERVTLPHPYNEDEAFALPIHLLSDSIVWYRKHFTLPQSAQGRKIFLEFEGARQAAEVWVNGKKLILYENGVMAFGIDISSLADFSGDNVVAVRLDCDWHYKERATDTEYQWNNINFNPNYGGLNKNVYLHVTDNVYQTLPLYSNLETVGTYVYASDIDIDARKAVVNAEAEVRNESGQDRKVSMDMVIEDMDGNVIRTVRGKSRDLAAGATETLTVSTPVRGLHFWSWGYGYLYNVYTKLCVDGVYTDVVRTRTGFRKTEFANGMFTLNDRVLHLKGYAQRTTNEWPAVGSSVPAWLSDYSNGLIVKGNGNLVRWMHITPWKQDVESCDRVGLIEAMPAGDAERDITGRQWGQRTELMRDAIIYNRNNPSIIFYECGNESISEEHMAEMKAIRDMYDPHGGRAIGSREMLDSNEAEYGGEMLYINKSADIPLWATEYCRDEGVRKYWDNYSYPYHPDGYGPLYRGGPAPEYNHNMDSYATQMVERWNDWYVVRPGTGRRVSAGGVNIGWADANSHYRGESSYRTSGEVDAMRIAKDAYWGHKVMWGGWCDIEEDGTYIIGHWNYEPGTVKNVYTVSTGESVELFVNGQSKGYGERSNTFLFTFPQVEWQAGEITAVSYDAAGNEISRTTKSTVGEPVSIRMTAMTAPDGFKADGADLALIEFEAVDAAGNRHPLANNTVHFTVDGPAEWRGGIAQGEKNMILSMDLPVEAGVNRAFVRSTTQAGTVRITATAEGLGAAEVVLQTTPFETVGGLSEYISSDHQPSYLERGETPKGPSYTVKRIDVPVLSAEASANQDSVKNSYDDNELSEWEAQEGSVTYTLERTARISEIDLKCNVRRPEAVTYAILIDDTEVWRGSLTRQYGYINNIRFAPTEGSKVTVKFVDYNPDAPRMFVPKVFELAGTNIADHPETAPADKNNPNNVRGFGGMGVTNSNPNPNAAAVPTPQQAQQTAEQMRMRNSVLNIIEIEFFEIPE